MQNCSFALSSLYNPPSGTGEGYDHQGHRSRSCTSVSIPWGAARGERKSQNTFCERRRRVPRGSHPLIPVSPPALFSSCPTSRSWEVKLPGSQTGTRQPPFLVYEEREETSGLSAIFVASFEKRFLQPERHLLFFSRRSSKPRRLGGDVVLRRINGGVGGREKWPGVGRENSERFCFQKSAWELEGPAGQWGPGGDGEGR